MIPNFMNLRNSSNTNAGSECTSSWHRAAAWGALPSTAEAEDSSGPPSSTTRREEEEEAETRGGCRRTPTSSDDSGYSTTGQQYQLIITSWCLVQSDLHRTFKWSLPHSEINIYNFCSFSTRYLRDAKKSLRLHMERRQNSYGTRPAKLGHLSASPAGQKRWTIGIQIILGLSLMSAYNSIKTLT